MSPTEMKEVLEALKKYEQLDLNGVFVKVSREAVEKAITIIEDMV